MSMYFYIILGVVPKTIIEKKAVITIYSLISREKCSVWAASWKGWKKVIWQKLEPSHCNLDRKGTLIKSNFLKSQNRNFITDDLCSHLLMLRNKLNSTQLEYITLRSFLDSVPLFSLMYSTLCGCLFIYLFIFGLNNPKMKTAHF